jgi:hypothetical protein
MAPEQFFGRSGDFGMIQSGAAAHALQNATARLKAPRNSGV